MNLPSNKVGIIFVVAVLIVAGTISFSAIDKNKANKDKENLEPESLVTIRRNTNANSVDTDSDGLYDWEETLRGTDVNNPDSDGDGTSDGDEVSEGRDPNTAGPNDTLEQINEQRLAELGALYEDFIPGSLTDDITVNFISNYYPNQNSFSDGGEGLAETIAQEAKKVSSSGDKYSSLDLRPFSVTNKDRVKQYGNELASVQTQYLQALTEISYTNDSAYINSIVNLYKNFAEAIIKIEVPQAVAKEHLGIANNYYKVSVALNDLNNAKTDPVKGLFAVQNYNDAAATQAEYFISIAEFLKSNDIIFNDDEPGNLWNQI